MNADRLKAGAALVLVLLLTGALYLMVTRGTAIVFDLTIVGGCF